MYCIIINNINLNMWWSTKCGCTFIKNLIYNEIEKRNIDISTNIEYIHIEESYSNGLNNYKNILVVRNPISRIISSFINKFVYYSGAITIYGNLLTFDLFVDLLYKHYICNQNVSFNHFIIHHTTPQFSEAFDGRKFDKIYCLEKFNDITYFNDYLSNFNIVDNETISNSKIHSNYNNSKKTLTITNAYLLNIDELKKILETIQISYESFLNDNNLDKLKQIYKIDYDILKEYNINYLE